MNVILKIFVVLGYVILTAFTLVMGYLVVRLVGEYFNHPPDDQKSLFIVYLIAFLIGAGFCIGMLGLLYAPMRWTGIRTAILPTKKNPLYAFYRTNALLRQNYYYLKNISREFVRDKEGRVAKFKLPFTFSYYPEIVAQYGNYNIVLLKYDTNKWTACVISTDTNTLTETFPVVSYRQIHNALFIVKCFEKDGKTRYEAMKFATDFSCKTLYDMIYPISLEHVEFHEMLVVEQIALLPRTFPGIPYPIYESISREKFEFIYWNYNRTKCFVVYCTSKESYVLAVDRYAELEKAVTKVYQSDFQVIELEQLQHYLLEGYLTVREGKKVILVEIDGPPVI
jgi:hypothetical protein